MNAVPSKRGDALLLAHCSSLDPTAVSARERLEDAIGPELARKLVSALCSGGPSRNDGGLGSRMVFAA